MFDLKLFRRTSFIALLAIIMLALAPTVSKLITANRLNVNLVEVCNDLLCFYIMLYYLVHSATLSTLTQ